MSHKRPIKVKIEDKEKVLAVFPSDVVKSGNGAVIKAYKRFIGKDVIVIVKNNELSKNLDKKRKTKEIINDSFEDKWKKL